MIKNKATLLVVKDRAAKSRRKIILDIIEHVLSETSPHALLKPYITALNAEAKKYKKIVVIGIGKAARTMGEATVDLLQRKPTAVLYADTGHPLPTPTGVKKTARIISAAQKLGADDLAIVLLSGGGSAMFEKPVENITLEDLVETTTALLKCGATINEINSVRKHLSQVKGGRFARLLAPATVKAFVISDVVGNDLSTIASGPLTADPTTFADALKILRTYKAPVPNAVWNYLESNSGTEENESVKKNDASLKKVTTIIIADHLSALTAAANKAKEIARKTKHTVVIKKEMLSGEARHAARDFVRMLKPHSIVIACGETTVTCTGDGYGGRNQEFALSSLDLLLQHQAIASFGTDGVDGMCPVKVAGAVADSLISDTAADRHLSSVKYLKNNDSYAFFKKTGGLIITGPTGNNLGDIVVGLSDTAHRK